MNQYIFVEFLRNLFELIFSDLESCSTAECFAKNCSIQILFVYIKTFIYFFDVN